MTETISMEAINEQYLSAALIWLRLRLLHLINRATVQEMFLNEADTEALVQATNTMAACEASDFPPALIILSRQFGLSRFERETLLLCIAMELDTHLAGLCAKAQGNPAQAYPTFALALALFERANWDILSPESPLRYWRLIEIIQSGVQPLTTSPLRADERIVNYIKGLNYLDDRLTPLVTLLEVEGRHIELPESQQTIVEEAVRFLQGASPQKRIPLIQLIGIDKASKQLIAWHIASKLGLQVYYLPHDLIPDNTATLETFARLWQRETLLLPIALYIDAYEVDELGDLAAKLNRLLARSDGLFFLGTRDVRQDLRRTTLDLDIRKPTAEEQQVVWRQEIGDEIPEIPSALAGQFNLGLQTIHEVAQTGLAEHPNGETLYDSLWDACLVRTRPQLDTLAERLQPKATWDDIVLPENMVILLRHIANQVRQRGKVYEEWGFRKKMSRGLGMVTLFSGESGTGKTMAAEVIANDLRLNLYRIDLSAVVSKYIGETEKNLRRLFDAAEDGGAILFFDEADALFGKRSQVKDSHDRYANIETNYLLQRMEAYQGLAILATNMKMGLDEAFTRRLRFIVDFPVPQAEDRQRIWKKIFPTETPVGNLDYDYLAAFDLPGGAIYNAALNAAFLAAQENSVVEMPHVLTALLIEFRKSDQLIDERKFIWKE